MYPIVLNLHKKDILPGKRKQSAELSVSYIFFFKSNFDAVNRPKKFQNFKKLVNHKIKDK